MLDDDQPMTDTAKAAAAVDKANRIAQRVMPRPFKVASVEKIDPPNGAQGSDWHRYVLDNSRSQVNGLRRGTRKDVMAYAAQCAEQLNVRGLTAQSIWAPRGRKPAGAVAAAAASSSSSET
jgi:hypothetical protein